MDLDRLFSVLARLDLNFYIVDFFNQAVLSAGENGNPFMKAVNVPLVAPPFQKLLECSCTWPGALCGMWPSV